MTFYVPYEDGTKRSYDNEVSARRSIARNLSQYFGGKGYVCKDKRCKNEYGHVEKKYDQYFWCVPGKPPVRMYANGTLYDDKAKNGGKKDGS